MHIYHVLIDLGDGTHARHCDLHPNGAAAALRVAELYPQAVKIDVLRLTTVLLRLPDVRYAARQPIGGAA